MKRTFRAFRNGVEVGKTTTLRDDRAYVAAVVHTYPDRAEFGKFAGKVRVAHWSSDKARAQSQALSDGANLSARGFAIEVVYDVRLDAPKAGTFTRLNRAED